MKTLYEQKPETWSVVEKRFPYLAEMAKRFYVCADIDKALGFLNAASAWHSGRVLGSRSSNDRAGQWLKENDTEQPLPKPQGGTMLMVVCPPNAAEKAMRLLAFLGCEVVEV